MKIKIIKASVHTYWYAKLIGSVFEVVGRYRGRYMVNYKGKIHYTVSKEDCEVIK